MTLDSDVRAGNPLQWLQEHGNALYGYAMLRVGNASVAEDLLQETLLAALQAVDSFKGESSERTWLTAILKRKVCDYLRKTGREISLNEKVLEKEDTAAYFDETGHWKHNVSEWGDPQLLLENEEFQVTMQNCIARLPDRLRALYTLRELDRMSSKELIETLNISSENNYWVMLSRARVHLRQCLELNWFTS